MDYLIVSLFTWLPLIGLISHILSFYILSLLPTMDLDYLTLATFTLAIATFLLVWENHRLSKDSSKNIEVSKNNLVEQHLVKEMEHIIKPLYERRDNFEDLEYRYLAHTSDVDNVWKRVETDKYLASKDIRHNIESYLKAAVVENEKFKAVTQKIWHALQEEKNDIPERVGDKHRDSFCFDFGQHMQSCCLTFRRNDEQADNLIGILKSESKLRNYLIEYTDLIKSNNLALMRAELRDKIINRYTELEEKIDAIQESLDN